MPAPTQSLAIDPQSIAARYTVMGATVPPEGPRAIAIPLDFTQTQNYTLDLQNIQQRNFFSMIQGLFVDNSQNPSSLTINFPNTGQNLIFEAGQQAYIGTLCQNPAKVQFMSAGDVAGVMVYILNYPVTNDVWQANAASAQSTTVTFSGGLVGPELVANYTKANASGAAITNSAAALITGAPGYYIGGFAIFLTSDSTLTAGTDLQVSLVDSTSGTIALVNLSPINGIMAAEIGLFWNNKTALSNLSLNFSTSLATGGAYYTIPYGIASFVG
jgi:hypothetical protein